MNKIFHKNNNIKIWIVGAGALALLIGGVVWGQRASLSRSATTTTAEAIEMVGSPAPDFTLPSTAGDPITLSDFRGKKNVLLYFQEGVMCDPCWRQTLDIEKDYGKFQEKDIDLITITVDPLNALKKNAERFGITLPILEDADLKVSAAYDVLKDAMHPGSRPGHTFVLVDKNGTIVWRKAYFIASGSTKMTMEMGGNTMTMDMGMDMGTPDSVMYLPVDKLWEDLADATSRLAANGAATTNSTMQAMNMATSAMSMQDHTMCLTPIHKHVDFKMYVAGAPLSFSRREFMDQDNKLHFHPTVKVRPEDVPNIPNGAIIHVHEEKATLLKFLKTLDLPFDVERMQELKVYANGAIQSKGLNYVIEDKDRILVTDSKEKERVDSELNSITDYAIQGKEKNPSLFGGC